MTVDPSDRTVVATCPLCRWLLGEARVAVATRPLRQALNQRQHYTDLRGVNHPLSDMTAAGASLVLLLLERHAATLHQGELAELLLSVDARVGSRQAAIEAYAALAVIPAEAWIRQTPLHRALTERAAQ